MRHPSAHLARTLALLLPLALLAAGCGSERADTGSRPAGTGDRAREVAAAWDGSRAAEVWRAGYYPLADVVQLPEHAFRNDDDKRAYSAGSFVLKAELPSGTPEKGKVEWESGSSLSLPLMDAREAYDSVAAGGGDGPHLTVTAVRLGGTTLVTSRGPATVPAWLFTLDGYDTPLKRVALKPSALPGSPIEAVGEVPTDDLMQVERLVEVSGDGRSVTVLAGHGACDDGAAVDVLETSGSVVLSASVVGASDGDCTAQLVLQEVTGELKRKLGDRVLLDAFTGAPVAPRRVPTT
ncbi:hypothetical protein DI272_06875 [Streptomyces sp. Act143]|uniref:hypothetical protein n=1 Tax=Streptomyces sp. Act143 TaxID=2200760 RepID=UPI000D677784|nr:hypothetical protein [Streptomyces sp. Act143]PWI13903.1 hypothetical protein DI272_06875 [Streptomyces sp. Act143]